MCKTVQTVQTQGVTCHFNKTELVVYFHTNWGTEL
jgi:hypothetical protein